MKKIADATVPITFLELASLQHLIKTFLPITLSLLSGSFLLFVGKVSWFHDKYQRVMTKLGVDAELNLGSEYKKKSFSCWIRRAILVP